MTCYGHYSPVSGMPCHTCPVRAPCASTVNVSGFRLTAYPHFPEMGPVTVSTDVMVENSEQINKRVREQLSAIGIVVQAKTYKLGRKKIFTLCADSAYPSGNLLLTPLAAASQWPSAERLSLSVYAEEDRISRLSALRDAKEALLARTAGTHVVASNVEDLVNFLQMAVKAAGGWD